MPIDKKSSLIILPEKTDLVPFTGAMHPLKTAVVDFEFKEGLTLLEMIEIAQPDPVLFQDAVVFVEDYEIHPSMWSRVRPKAGVQVTARILPVPRGGGGGGGKKNPVRTILTISVIAAAFFLGPHLGAEVFGLSKEALIFGQTVNLAGAVGGTLITVAGTLLVNAIAPIRPPRMAQLSGFSRGGVGGGGGGPGQSESPSLFLTGTRNTARHFGVAPSVLGFYRWRPPLGATTFTEVMGDHNVLRSLFVAGFGKLELSDFKIGDTPIDNFNDFELEIREGEVSDTPLTIYTDQVDQQEFSIKLLQTGGFQQRTSSTNGDELSVDITFPRGLMILSDDGKRQSKSVTFELEFRKVGDVTFLPLPGTFDSTFPASAVSGSQITISAARSSAIRHGVRWKTGERAQYEIQLRRITSDSTDASTFDDLFWTTLRTFTNDDPINFPVPLAKFALQIRSTDQLNGVVDELSVLAKSVVLDWDRDTMTYITRASNNPSALFRHVLQGPANARPLLDSEIDLTRLEEWHEFCDDKGFTFNMVRDFASSVFDTLTDIASAGRAGLTVEDGKWSVVIDQKQTIIKTHITPRNSTGFELEKAFFDTPHAWRIRFPNENTNFEQDERIVPRDPFTEETATLFESIELPGVTNPDQIFKLGRFHAAQIVQRPERWSVTQDFEAIIAKRGSRINVTHDVLVVGLASGRIKSLVTDGGGNVTSITVDEELAMEAGKSYALVIRVDVTGNTELTVPITTVVGTFTTVTPSPIVPSATAPEVGDLFGFGEIGTEVEDGIVLSNIPQSEFAAKIIIVPYRDSIYDADTEAIPPFVPNITSEVFLPAVGIQEVVADESVLVRGAGDTALIGAEIRVLPIGELGAFLEVQQRLTGSGDIFYDSQFSQVGLGVVRVSDVQQGETYDFRVRWNADLKLPGLFTETPNNFIVGKSSIPSGVVDLTGSVFGGQFFMRWDEPAELDVKFGGQVRFRHSGSFASPSWNESTSIGEAAQARSLFASLPLKPGTYLARVFDSEGNPSSIASIQTVSTKDASVLTFANVSSIDEGPTFPGGKTNVLVADSKLQLAGIGLFDAIPDLDLMTTTLDFFGGISLTGTYDFALGIDLGSVKRVRVISRITSLVVQTNDLIDDRTDLIDTWEDFDGTNSAVADVQIWMRTTDDDPAGSPTFTEFQRLDSAEVVARGLDFEARLTTDDASFNIEISTLGIDVEEVV